MAAAFRLAQDRQIAPPEQARLDTSGAAQNLSPARTVSSDPNAPVTAQETLTYASLLEDPDPLAEPLAPAAEPTTAVPDPVVEAQLAPATPPPSVAKSPVVPSEAAPGGEPRLAPVTPAARLSAAAPVTADADATLAEPPGTGFVVQVAAVRQRAAANAMARRLGTKGYPAFVTIAGPNFRVRVGKYNDRHEAESVAGRLEEEEQFKPWITR